MEKERMIEIAAEEGFAKAEVIRVEEFVCRHEFREFCTQNYCGNYGKNYACPPVCGEPQEMEDRLRKYEYAVVFQSRTPVQDISDDEETKRVKKKHTAMTLQVLKRYEQEGMKMDGLAVMAGPCNFCEQCKIVQGEPCCHEEMRFSCLSAYCIDAAEMAKRCQMDMAWNGDVVSFFSLYCFK